MRVPVLRDDHRPVNDQHRDRLGRVHLSSLGAADSLHDPFARLLRIVVAHPVQAPRRSRLCPVWRRRWFLLLVAVLAGIAAYAFHRYRIHLPQKYSFSNKTQPVSLLATAPFFRRRANILVGWIHRPRSTTTNGIANSNSNQPRQRAILYRPPHRSRQIARRAECPQTRTHVQSPDRRRFGP